MADVLWVFGGSIIIMLIFAIVIIGGSAYENYKDKRDNRKREESRKNGYINKRREL
jgi:hypothetical protein